MLPNKNMDILLNEMAVYKTELAKGSVESQFQRVSTRLIQKGIPI